MFAAIRPSGRPFRAALSAARVASVGLALGLAGCATEDAVQQAPELAAAPAPQAEVGPPRVIAPPPPPRQPDLVVIGAVAFAPAPEEFDQDNPVLPTLADLLADGFEDVAVRATGDGWGMAILCRMPETVARLEERGDQDLRQPDLVLLTRPPTEGEKALCEEQGVALETVPIGRYLGGLPNDGRIEGAWIAYSAARIADFPQKRALIDKARLLIGADGYSQHFSAL